MASLNEKSFITAVIRTVGAEQCETSVVEVIVCGASAKRAKARSTRRWLHCLQSRISL